MSGFDSSNLNNILLNTMDFWERKQQFTGDVPLSRFGHSATFYSQDKMCIFGGAIGSPTSISMTDTSYTLHLSTSSWKKLECTGLIPSARAAHGALSFQKNKIAVYGGATPKGLASDELYVLDLKQDVGIWNVVNVKGRTPGKRYAHSFLYLKPYIVVFGGNLDNQARNDVWVLDILKKPLIWNEIKFKCQVPKPRDYHSAALCATGNAAGMIVVFGGRTTSRDPLNDCWGLVRHVSTGQWSWIPAPIKQPPQPRYQHSSFFIKNVMLIVGGKNNENNSLPLQAYDTKTNRWYKFNTSIERFRHISWVFGTHLYTLGGLSLVNKEIDEDPLLCDLEEVFYGNGVLLECLGNRLRASNVSDKSSASETSTRVKSLNKNGSQQTFEISSVNNLSNIQKSRPSSRHQQSMLSPTKSQKKRPVILDPVYQKNNPRIPKPRKPLQQKSDIAHYFLEKLMHPSQFSRCQAPNVRFNPEQILNLCNQVEQIIASQPILLNIKAPLKIFGDLHGQYSDLMAFFQMYGTPHQNGNKKDIENFDYVFLGDYVDRGNCSLQTVCLLFALKIVYPQRVHLLRGNHQDAQVNVDFGFRDEIQGKIDQDADNPGSVFNRINQVFQWLPLAAKIEDQILCLHGGIGKGLQKIQQIAQIKRPLQILHEVQDHQSQLVLDILWSDPTQSDQQLGIHNNYPRNPKAVEGEVGDIVRFGPDRVHSFLQNNNLKMIIRAHECVMDGFQRFAGGELITVFSATDYCRKHKNAGAILVLKTNLQLVPKIIYPKKSNANTWLEEEQNSPRRCSTPPRWRTTR